MSQDYTDEYVADPENWSCFGLGEYFEDESKFQDWCNISNKTSELLGFTPPDGMEVPADELIATACSSSFYVGLRFAAKALGVDFQELKEKVDELL